VGNDGVPGYDVRSASSLFVIDRRGFLAGVPDEFYTRVQEGVNRLLPDLLSGTTQGQVIWALETRPKGWRELWRAPDVTRVVSVAVAPATSRGPLEIGVLDSSRRLRRYAADGSPLGEGALEESGSGLRGTDLDGDGEKEWIVWDNDSALTVVDSRGRAYWTQYGVEDPAASWDKFEVGGVADLDGDGLQEIVVRSEDSVTALRAVGQRQWVYRSGQPLSHVMVDSSGGIWAQSDLGLFPIDDLGRAGDPVLPSFGGLRFQGQIVGARGELLRVFASRPVVADIDHDLDGDGREDVLMSSRGGVSAYDGDGKTILSLSITAGLGVTRVALADLDGKPGDEMVIFIPQYGLVALGRQDVGARPAEAGKAAGGR
jgi:hypothetical protein